MFDTKSLDQVYTPEQVARMLHLSKNTVYALINRGEIVAKRIGKVFRIPGRSIAFVFTGLDYDLAEAEQKDLKNLPAIRKELTRARSRR